MCMYIYIYIYILQIELWETGRKGEHVRRVVHVLVLANLLGVCTCMHT